MKIILQFSNITILHRAHEFKKAQPQNMLSNITIPDARNRNDLDQYQK